MGCGASRVDRDEQQNPSPSKYRSVADEAPRSDGEEVHEPASRFDYTSREHIESPFAAKAATNTQRRDWRNKMYDEMYLQPREVEHETEADLIRDEGPKPMCEFSECGGANSASVYPEVSVGISISVATDGNNNNNNNGESTTSVVKMNGMFVDVESPADLGMDMTTQSSTGSLASDAGLPLPGILSPTVLRKSRAGSSQTSNSGVLFVDTDDVVEQSSRRSRSDSCTSLAAQAQSASKAAGGTASPCSPKNDSIASSQTSSHAITSRTLVVQVDEQLGYSNQLAKRISKTDAVREAEREAERERRLKEKHERMLLEWFGEKEYEEILAAREAKAETEKS